MQDQAARLREIIQQKRVFDKMADAREQETVQQSRVICVTSGKGGVGKTNLTLNLAIALSKQDKRVVVIDADLGLANVEVAMGMMARYSLLDVIRGEKTIEEVAVLGPNGIYLISGGSGLLELVDLSQEQLNLLINQFEALNRMADVILIDTGAGLSRGVISFVLAADEVIIVCTPEPTAITDAYAMIKAIGQRDKNKVPKILVNRVETVNEGKMTFEKLENASNRFLGCRIEKLGYLAEDVHVSRSVKLQSPFLLQFPNSVVSKNIELIASKLYDQCEADGGPKVGFLSRIISLFR